MIARKHAVAGRRPQLLDDQARTDAARRDAKSEDAWVADFISRLAGILRDIGAKRRKEK